MPIAVVMGTKRDRMGTQKKTVAKAEQRRQGAAAQALEPHLDHIARASAVGLWGRFRLCLAKKTPGEHSSVGREDYDDDAAVNELGDHRGAEGAEHDGGRKNGDVFEADGASCGVSLGACERCRDHKGKRRGGCDLGYVRASDADMG